MGVEIFDQGQLVYSGKNLPAGPGKIMFDINWPTTVDIVTSNRNFNDTENDNTGKIIANKAIEVTGVLINNFPLQVDLVDKLFNCRRNHDQQITHENFWDFNGKIQMNLTHHSPMRFMLSLQNQYDTNRLTWNNND